MSVSAGPLRRPSALSAKTATVAVVMPVRNEAAHVESTLASILGQSFSHDRTEVIVVDGGSTDGTRDLVSSHADVYPRIHLLDNPLYRTAVSLNIGIGHSSSDVIVRVDGHCRLATDYIERCIEALEETGAGNVGGLMRPEGKGIVGECVALALKSRFGVGDSRFHYLEKREFVDTVYLGAFRREVLEEVGGYDEGLIANEDFELNHRIREAGYGVLLSPEIVSTYFPRESLRELCRQYFTYGLWKAEVIRKHPESTQPRHLAAPALVLTLAAAVVAFVRGRRMLGMLPVVAYLGAAASAGFVSTRSRRRLAPVVTLVFSCMHVAWGTGALLGLISPRGKKRP